MGVTDWYNQTFVNPLKQAATNAWGSVGVHTGNWGTPDFSITEAAAKYISGGQNTDLTNAIAGYNPVSYAKTDKSTRTFL